VSRADRTRRIARLVAIFASANGDPKQTGQAKGLSVGHLVRATRASRATVYRDLELLRESGYDLRVETVNGEARYSLKASKLAIDGMTPKERAAIALARRSLSSIEGTWVVGELDAALARARPVEDLDAGVHLPIAPLPYHPDLLKTLHEGVTKRSKLRIRYRGAKDKTPTDRVVHPLHIQVVDQQPYLIAYDEKRREERTFKVARVSAAKLLRERSTYAPTSAHSGGKTQSVKVWKGEAVEVRIRIAKAAARYIAEWPLVPAQRLEPAPGGAIDVCATVYGVEESVRWTLRWGRNAEAIAPKSFRERVREELAGALAGYGVGGRGRVVSRDRETTREGGR
jgi:proteasome accessory factor C